MYPWTKEIDDKPGEQIISEARCKAMNPRSGEAFYSALAANLKIKRDDSQPTFCTEGTSFIYNDKFLRSLDRFELTFCILHETIHNAWLHPWRFKNLRGLKRKIANIAADLIINDYLVKRGYRPPKGVLIDPAFDSDKMTVDQAIAVLMGKADEDVPQPDPDCPNGELRNPPEKKEKKKEQQASEEEQQKGRKDNDKNKDDQKTSDEDGEEESDDDESSGKGSEEADEDGDGGEDEESEGDEDGDGTEEGGDGERGDEEGDDENREGDGEGDEGEGSDDPSDSSGEDGDGEGDDGDDEGNGDGDEGTGESEGTSNSNSGEPGSDGEPGDGEDGFSDSNSGDTEESMSETDWRVANQQTMNVCEKAGRLGAHIKAMIQAETQSKEDWKSRLWQYVDHVIPKDFSYRNPNKNLLRRRIIVAGLKKENCPRILLAVDVSGSITNQDLKSPARELTDILNTCRPEQVDVWYCDTSIKKEEVFYPDDPEIKLEVIGRGGTAFAPVFDRIPKMDQQPALLIYFTDLCTFDWPYVKDPGIPVIWLVPQRYEWYVRTIPFGEALILPDEAA